MTNPSGTLWWQRGVVYQIYPRSFMDKSGDGIGDLRGMIDKLDYLAWLGIDAIWFSPVFPSPMADFGYDVSDYTNIHPDFGTLADFDELLAKAHKHSIKILLDLVPSHTSDRHPWFIEARQSKDSPKRDWYLWHDPKPDGTPPNNWLSYFGGPSWTMDEGTHQYYMHNFLPEQPDLNYRNPEVLAAMQESIRFWLARGVDGFRIDVIHCTIKDDQFRDNPVNENYEEGELSYTMQRRVYSESRPEVHEMVVKPFRQVFDEFEERVSIGEIDYFLPLPKLMEYYGDPQPSGQGNELHLPFNFKLLVTPWNAHDVKAHVDEYDAAIPPHGWPNYVMGNHDYMRVATRVGQNQVRVAAMLLLTLRGTPTIYYGEELGMTNVEIPQELVQDPWGINVPGMSRDPVRTPMQWDERHNAGFTLPAVHPWLPLAPDYQTVNVAAQQADPASTLNFYKTLLAYRKATPALHSGSYVPLDAPPGLFAFIREYEGQRRLVVLNFESKAISAAFNLGAAKGKIALSTMMDGEREVELGSLEIRPDEGVIIELS
ncbi:MAG: alpha-amylase family glycosyl hydrolase [bacterium]|nr:alpha-amylase family glycosyl hydrolase [bacterium]